MDLWQAIKDDHRKVKTIFARLQSSGEDRAALLEQLQQELEAHTEGEEKAVYPELGKIDELKDLVEHSLEEHAEMSELLEKLDVAEEDEIPDLVDELQSAVEDHVQDEEEKIIPVAQKEIESDLAEDMLRNFQAAKRAVLAD